MAPDSVQYQSDNQAPISQDPRLKEELPFSRPARAIRSCWHRCGAFQQYGLIVALLAR